MGLREIKSKIIFKFCGEKSDIEVIYHKLDLLKDDNDLVLDLTLRVSLVQLFRHLHQISSHVT